MIYKINLDKKHERVERKIYTCHHCGLPFSPAFVLTLDEALRNGAIARGMEMTESEVKIGEEISDEVRAKILLSGDELLLRLAKILPDESFGRLKNILNG